jgi:hypothetical protein
LIGCVISAGLADNKVDRIKIDLGINVNWIILGLDIFLG